MEENVKNLWLSKIKSGKVAVIESHYAPNNTNCIWLKDGVMYVYGNSGWEALSSGSSGDDPRLVPPTSYPFEVPHSETEESGVNIYEDAEGLLDFTYIPEYLVYVIGKGKSGYYTLIGTLDPQEKYVWGELFPTTDGYEFYSSIINSQSTIVGRCGKRNDSEFYVETTNSFPQYDSVIFDTEYNTDKYPEAGPQVNPGDAY